MLKREGIVKLLFLLTAIFLFISDHKLRADSSSQTIDCDSHIVSTSYKRYSFYRYNDFYILCEPYTVQDGDWIYKIFRAKGELSQEDFGLFMRIFKNLNPHIKNTNTIKSGQRITIPLKKSKSNDFKEISPGVVELPTITLSQLTDASKPVKKPISNKSSLSSDAPFRADNSTSANPNPTSEIPVRQLKQYAALNNGQLMLKGKYYFPRDHQDDLVIDVSVNPLMQFNNGYKILFVLQRDMFDQFLDTIKTFWHDFKIMEFNDITSLSSYDNPLSVTDNGQLLYDNNHIENKLKSVQLSEEEVYVPINMSLEQEHKSAVKQILEITGYKYTSEKEFPLSIGNVKINVMTGVITKEAGSEILVVFGDIYGSALESLKNVKKGHIITISPLLTSIEAAKKIFSELGASTTENPSFVNPNNIKTIMLDGFYVKNGEKELFISNKPALLKDAFNYLNDKNITVIKGYNQP